MDAGPSHGHALLSVFDVREDSRHFLASLIESGIAPPDEARILLDQSLLGGAEQWHALLQCARSRRQARRHRLAALDGHDVLAFVWAVCTGADLGEDGNDDDGDGNGGAKHALGDRPWEDTDRFIRLARQLETAAEIDIRPPVTYDAWRAQQRRIGGSEEKPATRKKRKRTLSLLTSHYWPDEALAREEDGEGQKEKEETPGGKCSTGATAIRQPRSASRPRSIRFHLPGPKLPPRLPVPLELATASAPPDYVQPAPLHPIKKEHIGKKSSTESPYFPDCPPEDQTRGASHTPRRSARPPPGTVSRVPFPPLDAPSFGLIQEKVAHEPFWLLIAITFLIKTNGRLAIPAFWAVKQRFPAPLDLLDPRNQAELLGMIAHLGLPQVRLGYIYRYARGFLECPPTRGIRHRVKNYDKRDVSPPPPLPPCAGAGNAGASRSRGAEGARHGLPVDAQDLEAWEIGHLTQGKYALDSWRIFCRDELLGRASDWRGGGGGGGREAEGWQFQPEWMRTRPDDKELRACLRWMWMREGWEWDPETGQRSVLRDEMRRAVNEGRVEYDEAGGLRMLDLASPVDA